MCIEHNLDRHWRNARTHTLHDPVRWKYAIIGNYALSQIRFTAGYGAELQHEPVLFSHALLAATERLKLIVALMPGPWNPAVAAKQLATLDQLTGGRTAVNIVSGWFRGEFRAIADPEAVKAFGHEVKNAGAASPEGEGNWAKSTAFLHFQEEVDYFDRRVLPLVRALEQRRGLAQAA